MNHLIVVIVVMLKVFHVRFFIILFCLLISFIDYYKLNRLYKALALQKLSTNTNSTGKVSNNPPTTHHQQRRMPQHQRYQQQQNNNNIPSSSSLSTSPPTPTPMNINQFTPFYTQQSSYLPMPTTVTDSRKSKY
jgi:hypothetical protein